MMNLIKGILTTTGFTVFLFACCISTENDNLWYVPMLIGLAGMALVGIAVWIDYRERFKSDKPEPKKQKVIDVWIEDIHIQMPAPLTDFELAYLSTIRKDDRNERI